MTDETLIRILESALKHLKAGQQKKRKTTPGPPPPSPPRVKVWSP